MVGHTKRYADKTMSQFGHMSYFGQWDVLLSQVPMTLNVFVENVTAHFPFLVNSRYLIFIG